MEAILAKGPDATALTFRSQIRERRGDVAGALADMTVVVAMTPDDAAARVREIRLMDALGQTAAADERHRALLVDLPKSAGDAYLAQRNPDVERQLRADQQAERQQAEQVAQAERIDRFLRGMVADHDRGLDLFEEATEASNVHDSLDSLQAAENVLRKSMDKARRFLASAVGAAMTEDDRASFDSNLAFTQEALDIVTGHRQKLEVMAYGETSADYDPEGEDNF